MASFLVRVPHWSRTAAKPPQARLLGLRTRGVESLTLDIDAFPTFAWSTRLTRSNYPILRCLPLSFPSKSHALQKSSLLGIMECSAHVCTLAMLHGMCSGVHSKFQAPRLQALLAVGIRSMPGSHLTQALEEALHAIDGPLIHAIHLHI